jgi:single-strand DNA-binding protein
MPALNRVQLIGNLGKKPEMKLTPGGKKVTTFPVAVGQHWRGSDGEMKETTDWFNVEAWGRLAEICSEYLKKGSLVFLEGRLKTDRYEYQGETRYFTKVIANRLQMLDQRQSTEEPEPGIEELEID